VAAASLAFLGAAVGEEERKTPARRLGRCRSPVSVLFRNPTLSQPKLSPDGKSSLGLAEFPPEKVRLRGFDWANSGRVILSADAPDPKEQGVQPMDARLR